MGHADAVDTGSDSTKNWTSDQVCKEIRAGRLLIVEHENAGKGSPVWKFFGPVVKIGEDGSATREKIPGFAACRKCQSCFAFSSKTGTSHLQRHGDKCNKESRKSEQQLITKLFRVPVPQSSKDRIADAMVSFVCQDIRPFYAVEGEGLQKLCQEMINAGAKYGMINANDVLPSRHTVKNKTVKKAAEVVQSMTRVLQIPLEKQRVAFTTDLWSDDLKKVSYMDVTVYWVADFQLHAQILACNEFPEERKTAANILHAINTCLADYRMNADLVKGTAYFTTDCAANIKAALSEGLRMDCTAHRLNTILRSAWKVTENTVPSAKEFWIAVHELVTFVRQSNLQGHLNTTLKPESETRWNSFYYTLASVWKSYNDIVAKLMERPRDYGKIASVDKHLVQEMMNFLEVFVHITNALEAERVPTLQNVVLSYYGATAACDLHSDDSEVMKSFKTNIRVLLQQKLTLRPEHWIATTLDPSTRNLSMLQEDEKVAKMMEIRGLLLQKMTRIASDVTDMASSAAPNSKRSKFDPFQQFRTTTFSFTPAQRSLEEELNEYFYNTPFVPAEDGVNNPLQFWKSQEHRLPRLAELATQIFVIPASSSSSERTFSAAGRILEKRRSRLNPSTVDAILKVRSYMKWNK